MEVSSDGKVGSKTRVENMRLLCQSIADSLLKPWGLHPSNVIKTCWTPHIGKRHAENKKRCLEAVFLSSLPRNILALFCLMQPPSSLERQILQQNFSSSFTKQILHHLSLQTMIKGTTPPEHAKRRW
jgi:hypothetical protein